MRNTFFAWAALAASPALLGGQLTHATPLPPAIAPTASWRIEPPLTNSKEAENISGIACSAAPKPACVLVSDEQKKGRYLRWASLGDQRLQPGEILPLFADTEGNDNEADTEAAAYADGFFYVIGSHGVAKKKGEYQRDRNWLFRFTANASRADQVERTNALETLLGSLPELKASACSQTSPPPCQTLQEGGLNVEGLAVRNGQAWIGLRAPLLAGDAVVVKVGADSLFGGSQRSRASLHRVALGEGRGIRDLASVQDGVLILTGKSNPEAEDETPLAATVVFWRGDAQAAIPIATLSPSPTIAKPEALLLLGEDERSWRVLVLGEGTGAIEPQEFRLPKPAGQLR
jgi:hypothetical protein